MTADSLWRWTGFAAATSALALLTACGGGGSGGSSTPTTPAAEKGTVSVLLTDAPTDDFCHAIATVESIDLLGDGGRENIWTGNETIDVLALRNYSDVFVVNTEVTVASYDKIRLTLADLAIEKCDDTGTVIETYPVKLPGNGKLDLNPRGTFQVVGNEALLIEIDLDMKHAVHVVEAGNSMHYEFRPVVFVTITPDDSRMVRVFGTVRDLEEPGFELCPLEPVASTDDDADEVDDEAAEGDDDSGRCIDVVTDAATGIFDANGDPVGLDALANGDFATAIGFLRAHDDSDDDDDRADDLLLDAVTVEIGPVDTFARVRGAAESAVGNNDRFAFLPEGGTSIDVLLQAGTRIFGAGSAEELTSAAVQPGVLGQVDGVQDAADADTLKSSLIVLEEGTTAPEVALLDATVASIDADDDADPATRQLFIDNADVTNQCVKTDADTRIIEVMDGPDSIEAMAIGVDDLSVGQTLDVYGHDDGGGCVVATTIQAYAP